jgi:uncharacterized membrane protein
VESIASSAIGTGILILLIFAAVQQHRSDLAAAVRWLIYVALTWYVAGSVAGFAISIYVGLQLAARKASPATLMTNPALQALVVADLIFFWLIGGLGLILMWRHQNSFRTPPPLAPGNAA